MISFARKVRDYVFALLTIGKRFVDIDGVKISLDAVSPRVRYVLFHGYEKEEASLVARLLNSNDRVLEAGSAIGFLAAYTAKKLGIKDYCLVEANPGLPKVIEKNFALNDLSRPLIINAAVAEKDGQVSFGLHRNFWSSSVVDREDSRRITVPARSLPSIISELPFRPNVLIMDIEGGEINIPPDHFSLFEKIVIETHPHVVGGEQIAHLTNALHQQGFHEVYSIGCSRAYTKSV